MKNKLLSLFLALSLLLTPVFAEDAVTERTGEAEQTAIETTTDVAAGEADDAETAAPALTFSVARQENIVRTYAHYIADTYYYGVSDSNLLYAMICSAIENDGVFDLDLAFEAMIDVLGDEYAEFYPPEVYSQQVDYYTASFYGIGVVMTQQNGGTVVDSVYIGSSAEEVGLKAGDVIIAVDGTDTSGMGPSDVRGLVVGEEGTTVQITVLRGEETLTFHPIRRRVTESHSSMNIINEKLAYITVSSFTSSLPEDFDGYLAKLSESAIKDVIIDLRDNGGGDLDAAIETVKKLIPAGAIGKIKRYRDPMQEEIIYSENTSAPDLNILVLVNENTASASEFFAMALQYTGRAKLLGTNTYGKGCMQAMMSLPTGSGMKFTIGEFFTPDDVRIHTVGLVPDITVENLVEEINPDDFERIDFMNLDSEATCLAIEQRLNAVQLLPDSETDGVFNDYTEAAIRVFQRYSGLEETGELDFYTALKICDYEYVDLYKVTDEQTPAALKYFGQE